MIAYVWKVGLINSNIESFIDIEVGLIAPPNLGQRGHFKNFPLFPKFKQTSQIQLLTIFSKP